MSHDLTPGKEHQTKPAQKAMGINWRWVLSTFGPLFGLVFVCLFFSIAVPIKTGEQQFIKPDNMVRILLHTAVVGTAAIGATLIIISGGIDLSVAGTIAL